MVFTYHISNVVDASANGLVVSFEYEKMPLGGVEPATLALTGLIT